MLARSVKVIPDLLWIYPANLSIRTACTWRTSGSSDICEVIGTGIAHSYFATTLAVALYTLVPLPLILASAAMLCIQAICQRNFTRNWSDVFREEKSVCMLHALSMSCSVLKR